MDDNVLFLKITKEASTMTLHLMVLSSGIVFFLKQGASITGPLAPCAI